MLHTHRKLLMLLIASLVFVLLPAASAMAGGIGPAGPGSFTMEGIQREDEKGCLPNDTSPGNSIIAHVLITHQEGKTLQVAATTETIEGEEIAYVGETYVKSEEVYTGIRMNAVINPEKQKIQPVIGPWTFASFKFYDSNYEIGVGEGDMQFEPCLGSDQSLITEGPVSVTTESGKSILINVLENDGKGLEVIGVSKPTPDRGWSNDPHNGKVFIEDNEVRYTPPAQTKDYQVSFAYFVSNDKGGWAEGFVTVEVFENSEPTPKPPVVVVQPPPEPAPKGSKTPVKVSTKAPLKGGAPYDLTLSKKVHISHNVASVILTCLEQIECSGILNLELGNRIVGAQQYAVGKGSWVIRIKLTKAAARSIRKTKGKKLTLLASATCCRKTVVAFKV
jgi:hypothetical protein